MTDLYDALQELEAAIERLEQAAGKLPPRLRPESSVLAQTATQVAARLDAAIGRLDRILED